MNNANGKEREERALEALIVASFYTGQEDSESFDNPDILNEEDRRAMASLGHDLIDRIVAGSRTKATRKRPALTSELIQPEVAALNRGDEQVTEAAKEEMETKRKELLCDSEEEGNER